MQMVCPARTALPLCAVNGLRACASISPSISLSPSLSISTRRPRRWLPPFTPHARSNPTIPRRVPHPSSPPHAPRTIHQPPIVTATAANIPPENPRASPPLPRRAFPVPPLLLPPRVRGALLGPVAPRLALADSFLSCLVSCIVVRVVRSISSLLSCRRAAATGDSMYAGRGRPAVRRDRDAQGRRGMPADSPRRCHARNNASPGDVACCSAQELLLNAVGAATPSRLTSPSTPRDSGPCAGPCVIRRLPRPMRMKTKPTQSARNSGQPAHDAVVPRSASPRGYATLARRHHQDFPATAAQGLHLHPPPSRRPAGQPPPAQQSLLRRLEAAVSRSPKPKKRHACPCNRSKLRGGSGQGRRGPQAVRVDRRGGITSGATSAEAIAAPLAGPTPAGNRQTGGGQRAAA